MKTMALVSFMAILVSCTFLGIPLVLGLVAGLLLFTAIALRQGHGLPVILAKAGAGILTVKKILLLFILAGMVSSLWRASGTLPFLVAVSSKVINPYVMLPLDFLLCVFVSFLTGTSFGTAATMGVLAMVISNSMGINPILSGGAVISGIFFGDRTSPVSTTAMLIAEITGSDLHQNLRRLLKESLMPVAITTLVYLVAGLLYPASGSGVVDASSLFPPDMVLSPLAAIPAVLILVLSFFSVPVLVTLSVSIMSAVMLAFFLQGMGIGQILSCAVFGYSSGGVVSGGILSMTGVFWIVLISSCYVGIFRLTDMLEPIERAVMKMEWRFPRYAVTLAASLITATAACNQTLTIILTKELCSHMYNEGGDLAVDLGDTATLVPALIPWSIAVSTPLASINAPMLSIPFAFFLIILPLWKVLLCVVRRPAGARHAFHA